MQIVLSFVFAVFLAGIVQTFAIRCYICGPDSQNPFKATKPLGKFNSHSSNSSGRISSGTTTNNKIIKSIFTSCEIPESSDSIQDLIMECPSLYSGCITEIEGNRTTRTCEILDVNDCKIANNITYCYCNTDLCNGENVATLTSRAWKSHRTIMENSDDEDLSGSESSGMDDENGYHRKRKNRIKSTIDDDDEHSSSTSRVLSIGRVILYCLISTTATTSIYFVPAVVYIPNIFSTERYRVGS